MLMKFEVPSFLTESYPIQQSPRINAWVLTWSNAECPSIYVPELQRNCLIPYQKIKIT